MKINGSLKFIPFIDPSNLLSSVKSGLYTFMEIVESNNPTSKIVIFDILPYRSSYSLWVLIAFGGFFFSFSNLTIVMLTRIRDFI